MIIAQFHHHRENVVAKLWLFLWQEINRWCELNCMRVRLETPMELSGARSIFFEWEGVHDVLQSLADAFRIGWLRISWGATVGWMRVQTFLIAKLRRQKLLQKTESSQTAMFTNSPCRQLRSFYIMHRCWARNGTRERRTCPVPCERWRRNFSRSFRSPKSSSNERELQRLFGHRPGLREGDGRNQ